MTARYFKNRDGVVSVYVALADTGAEVLADAGLTEITAEEYQAEQGKQDEARTALLQPAAATDSTETTKEAVPSGGHKRQRRR
ncbi:hypothetical protein [Streptomyces sp. NBC_00443]|uniref:hypothetical protein n=1 Tax=Streptomyces sp. NBC_00443 TaxID=2975743 RepID=UPI002E233F4D